MSRRLIAVSILLATFLCAGAEATTVRFQTNKGNIDINLFDADEPITVANFLAYVNSNSYNNSFVHRSEPGFVIQGGGYLWSDAVGYTAILTNAPIVNEFKPAHSNVRGTIAMAKLSGDPNSATSQWFINLADNSSSLDTTNGGYTVFGQVTTAGMATVDAIAALNPYPFGGVFNEVPVINYTGGNVTSANLVMVQSASVISSAPAQGTKLAPGVIDIDGTGKQNILVRKNDNTQMQVARYNTSTSKFVFTAQDDPGPNFRLVAAADLDGNGKSDLVFLDTTMSPVADIRIWPDFKRSGEKLWRQVKPAWDAQVVGDLDGDGNADITWRYLADDPRDTGVSYIWFYNGTNAPVVRKRGGAPLSWTLLGAGDFNSDGAADMVYISPDKQIRVLMATGSRTCANVSADNVPAGYTPLKIADFTKSGRGDIFMRNLATGQNTIRVMTSAGFTLPPYTGNPDDPNASCTSTALSLTSVNFNFPLTDVSWKFYAAGDFDGDGYTDIVWLRPDGTLTLWLMNPSSVPSVVDNAGTAPAGYTVFQPGGGGASF